MQIFKNNSLNYNNCNDLVMRKELPQQSRGQTHGIAITNQHTHPTPNNFQKFSEEFRYSH